MAFEPESVTIAISDIFPLKTVPASVRGSRKYRQIAASMKKARIAQPPIVSRHPSMKGRYLLLDGHLRIEVLKEQGEETVTCLVSLDDEAFTYNRQVNHLATIQEHKMILKLVERGIPEQTIAETLDVDVASIRMKRDLLNGISPDAAEMLKDRQCPINTIQTLKKMKPDRQVEAVELMIAMNDFTVSGTICVPAGRDIGSHLELTKLRNRGRGERGRDDRSRTLPTRRAAADSRRPDTGICACPAARRRLPQDVFSRTMSLRPCGYAGVALSRPLPWAYCRHGVPFPAGRRSHRHPGDPTHPAFGGAAENSGAATASVRQTAPLRPSHRAS